MRQRRGLIRSRLGAAGLVARLAGLSLLTAVASGSFGCAEERDPINRVQPNALSKAFFVGADYIDTIDDPSFYARASITDVGYGAAQDGLFTSTYAQPTSVIKWEVTEDLLIGRIVYNRIIAADGKGDGEHAIDGQVAYVFPIQSHFDIRRDYNPTTGEESNVIVENTSDRAWNERDFFRVDWSRNLNTDAYDFDTLSLVGIYGGVAYEPVSYYVNDPNHPDAPHFATAEGYFDITTKAYAVPGMIDLSHLGWGIDQFPSCYLPNDVFGGSQPFGNCNPVELTLRMSFRRAETSDYQPADWDGNRFRSFGIFYGERFGYARNYGITDNQYYRLAARYNIWEKHHYYEEAGKGDKCTDGLVPSKDFPGQCEAACYTSETTGPGDDPNRDTDGNGTADECEFVGYGSQCDRFKQKCTLPFQDRKEKPVVWHYTKDSAQEYFDGTEWAAHEWDVAMRTAVRGAKYAECLTVTADPAGCESSYPMYRGQQDENQDAIELSREVDDCKKALGAWKDNVDGEPWSEDRVAACNAKAEEIGNTRGYSAGVISIAQMDEMVTLCHSPVQVDDSPACIADIQKAMPEAVKAKDKRQVLPAEITAADCDEQFQLRFDQPGAVDAEVLKTCDNGFYVRIGDLRYHQVNTIRNPQTPSPWGIMADADDPRTGEKVQASINVWAHVNDLASQGLVDTLGYIAGEIPVDEITDGTYVRDWAAAAEAASGKGALGTMDRATVERRKIAAFDGRTFEDGTPRFQPGVESPRLPKKEEINPEVLATTRRFYKEQLTKVTAGADEMSVNRPYTEARRLAAMDTQTEAALVTKPMMQLAGLNKSEIQSIGSEAQAGNIGGSVLASASILRNLNPTIRREFERARELGLASRGACILSSENIMAPAPNSLADLSEVMARKFGPWTPGASKADRYPRQEAIRKYIAQRYQYAVIAHEMGHSIGLRHNFVSSYYAFGFRPQYWQLRTKDGTVTEKCEEVSATGEECVGPRYFDPPTATEQDNLIWMFQQSTVMDYPGELTQDMIGLGAYDFAAARMFYGDVMSVFNDGSKFNSQNKEIRATLLNITDTFGGIIGYQYQSDEYDTPQGPTADPIHYSQLNDQLGLIENCTQVNPDDYRPASWDESKYGAWDPLLDGLIVNQNGTTTKCKTPQVDYVQYNRLRPATLDDPNTNDAGDGEAGAAGFYGSPGRAVEIGTNRLRVPYGFATDSWADLGNLSVYRHDNGADPYELFNFLVTEQEARHIFDNYRRSRTTFSVRTQSGRILGRYNEKMRDGAKGLGLVANGTRLFYQEVGFDFDALFPGVANLQFPDNILASGLAFDHFTRQFARPQSGLHSKYVKDDPNNPWDQVLRPHDAAQQAVGDDEAEVALFDGGTGYFGQVAAGAKLIENRLSEDQGEFDRDYTMNVGSYYDKVYAPYLLTESVDNFISDSANDFIDPRNRAVSMADLYPDGYRRFLANNLTGDDFIKGARLAADAGGDATLDPSGYPSLGIGWVSWWTPTPEVCFPGPNATVCSTYGCPSGATCEFDGNLNLTEVHPLNPQAPANTAPIDPLVGWEEQKWLVAQTLLYLPENARTSWVNLMGIWELGSDTDPGFENRIELHLPNGRVYIARTYGTEEIFGKTVQRGVGARVLEYANELAFRAYECTTATSTDGSASWCLPAVVNGEPVVKFDPTITSFGLNPTCNAADNSGCTCSSNRSCEQLNAYESVPAFIRQAMRDFRMADASMKGIYD